MTKRDLKAVATAGGIAAAAFFAFWLLRRTVPIREIAPTQVKWEGA